MSAAPRLWHPTGATGATGIDLPGAPLAPHDLRAALEVLLDLPAARDASFVVVPVLARRAGDLDAAVEQAAAALVATGRRPRVTVALDVEGLGFVPADAFARSGMGLMLDGVDEQTAFAHIAHTGLQAIRFDPRFLARARQGLRARCMLDAALSLARDLGLASLGDVGGSPDAGDLRTVLDWTTCAAPARAARHGAREPAGRVEPATAASVR